MAQDERDYMRDREKRRYLSWLYDGKPPTERVAGAELPKLPPLEIPVLVRVFLAVALALVVALVVRAFR